MHQQEFIFVFIFIFENMAGPVFIVPITDSMMSPEDISENFVESYHWKTSVSPN
jgi:hypothetical protein